MSNIDLYYSTEGKTYRLPFTSIETRMRIYKPVTVSHVYNFAREKNSLGYMKRIITNNRRLLVLDFDIKPADDLSKAGGARVDVAVPTAAPMTFTKTNIIKAVQSEPKLDPYQTIEKYLTIEKNAYTYDDFILATANLDMTFNGYQRIYAEEDTEENYITPKVRLEETCIYVPILLIMDMIDGKIQSDVAELYEKNKETIDKLKIIKDLKKITVLANSIKNLPNFEEIIAKHIYDH